jgi:hypothetical protein
MIHRLKASRAKLLYWWRTVEYQYFDLDCEASGLLSPVLVASNPGAGDQTIHGKYGKRATLWFKINDVFIYSSRFGRSSRLHAPGAYPTPPPPEGSEVHICMTHEDWFSTSLESKRSQSLCKCVRGANVASEADGRRELDIIPLKTNAIQNPIRETRLAQLEALRP